MQTTGVCVVEERDRAVLHLAGRVRLGRDVGDLLQLQGALEADRQADVAAEVEEERLLVMARGDLVDRVVAVEERRRSCRAATGSPGAATRSPPAAASRAPRRAERQQVHERHLRRERLRRRDPHLEPGARVEDAVDLAGDLRAHHVRDAERVRPLLAGEAHRGDRVGGLARLGDADDERVAREHRVAVAPLARDVGLAGDARPLLDHVAPDDARVV